VDNSNILLDRQKSLQRSMRMSIVAELLSNSCPSNPDDIERDIGDLLQISNRARSSKHIRLNDDDPLPKSPMPDYVEHKEGVNQVGRLSAEGIVREYDAAVKEIEALGAELTEAAYKCEAMVSGGHSLVNEMKELASNYREEGRRYFLQIEECSLMTSEVRTVCEALKKKIAATS
jgi:hypothetical protein